MAMTGTPPRPGASSGGDGDATVFFMTDVVGSTALWETHRDAMGASLELHDRVVHGAMEAAGAGCSSTPATA